MVQTDDLEVYRVGGSVRDDDPRDEDFVVVGVSVDEMKDRGFTDRMGSSVPVFRHPETNDEWSIAQTPDGSPADTIEEDLARRDLTVNAMARNVSTGELIDPFGGQKDLEDKVLRHVGESFTRNPFHVLRVALFAARFSDFTIADETRDLCQEISDEVILVHPQRLNEIISKNFRLAENPRKFFDVLDEFGALEYALPLLSDLQDIPAGPEEYHREGSAYEHTMRVITEAFELDPNNEYLLWAALGHDLGKVATDSADLPNHPKHTKTGPDVIEEFASRLKLGHPRKRVMKTAARHHMRFWNISELNASTLLETTDKLGGDEFNIESFILLGIADGRGREPASVRVETETVRENLELAAETINEITGKDIIEKFDVDPENGQKIYDLRLQERVRSLKEKRKHSSTVE
jgi:tRNA nucleotidyltransferase (CCA-adding enzyme)